MKKFLKDFREFALKGNVLDLAVGVIIGGAFGKIVTSLVNDILMPLIGLLLGRVNFTALKWVLRPAEGNTAELALQYGNFIQNILDFTIIAFCIYLMVQAINRLHKKEDKPTAPPTPPKTEILLEEIRDLLKNKD